MATLIHLNGAPAVGKSTLARRLVDDRPLALNLDIDSIRVQLGQWQVNAESKRVARALALVMAEAHLRSGHDVVLPQLDGRLEFTEMLESVAVRAGAAFLDVMLVADVEEVVRRFDDRRLALGASGAGHPQDEIPAAEVRSRIEWTLQHLPHVISARPSTIVVDVSAASVDETYAALADALDLT